MHFLVRQKSRGQISENIHRFKQYLVVRRHGFRVEIEDYFGVTGDTLYLRLDCTTLPYFCFYEHSFLKVTRPIF